MLQLDASNCKHQGTFEAAVKKKEGYTSRGTPVGVDSGIGLQLVQASGTPPDCEHHQAGKWVLI